MNTAAGKTTLKKFWNLVREEKKDIASIYFYAILNGMMQLSVPIGIQAIIGFVLGASMVTSIYVLIFLVVLGVLIAGIMQINQMRIIEQIQQRIFTRYAFEFVEKVPKFDLFKADNYHMPDKVSRFFDTLNLQKGFSKLLLDIPTAIIQILFGLILLSFYHPFFIVFGFVLVLLLWLLLYFTGKNGLQTSIQESNYKYQAVSWMQELGSSVKTFKINQDSNLNLKTTDAIIVNYLNYRTRHFKILLSQYKTLIAFKTIITAILLIVGVFLLIKQQLNIGEFIAAEIVIITIINSVERLLKNLDTLYDVLTAMEKITSVTEGDLEEDGAFELKSNSISLELNDFSFAYPDAKPVLKNMNFVIPANSTVCIIGEENAGTSTLLKILSTSYLHFEGSFLVNNIPLNNYNLESVRKKIGIFFNRYEVFTGSILDNISMGRSDITPEQIFSVARELGFENFLNSFPLGFQTLMDKGGKRLTNNIMQKIVLLRAMVHHPSLLIMEEPWVGLEESYKQKIIHYLLNRPFESTLIMASNDLAFAKKCDYSFELKNGHLKSLK